MDEIEYKLESKNPVLISHAISKLFESIKKKYDTREGISKVPEFQLLLSKRDSADSNLSISVYQVLTVLVENGFWDVKTALSTFSSSSTSSKNLIPVATAIGRLMTMEVKRNDNIRKTCPFMFSIPQHPLVTILIRDKCSWQTVLHCLKILMTSSDRKVRENAIEIIRPLCIYVLCNPSSDLPDNCKKETWRQLITSEHTVKLELEILLWLRTNEPRSCLDTNFRILDLVEAALSGEGREHCTALLPIIVSLTIRLLEYGFDPTSNFYAISSVLRECKNYAAGNISIILALMAELITLCPAIYLYNILEICTTIVRNVQCDELFLNILVASLLKWMAYPSVLCSDALEIARDLINLSIERQNYRDSSEFSSNKKEIIDEICAAFEHSDCFVQFYSSVLRNFGITTHEDTFVSLTNLSFAPMEVKSRYKLLLSGIILQTTDPKIAELACKILVEIANDVKSFGSHALSVILHKLTKCKSSIEAKYLLLAVPELVTTKENIPIIAHALDSLLNGRRHLRYFAIELYLKALEKEGRCYRFVSAAIIRTMKDDVCWYADATCARAMKSICESRPEHGEKLVPLLSQILNRCVDMNGGTATALALRSISALCKSAVIGICSTWRVLSPKMEKENRTIVLESLCELLGDIPSYPSQCDQEYDKLIDSVLSILWRYTTRQDLRVIESALKAIASYHLDQIPLNSLPAEFRCNLVLPAAYAEITTDAEKKPEDVLPYIPATCWIQMLQKINKSALTAAGDLLISFISREVAGFRSGIYLCPRGEPQNFKYLPEKSVIRAVGEYLRRCDKSQPNDHRVIFECLRIFAHRYSNPLPNINWSFLQETIDLSTEAKERTLLIACHQSTISSSARSFIENYLLAYKSATDANLILQSNEYLILYSCLEDLCQALRPNNLKLFFEVTLEHAVERINFDHGNSLNPFDRIMDSFGRVLKVQELHDENFTLLSTILEELFDKVDLTKKNSQSYVVAALELPSNQLERITSPRVWWEITPLKLKNAISIGVQLTRRRSDENPYIWINETMNVTATFPSVQSHFLESIRNLQIDMRHEESSVNWTLGVTALIQELLVKPLEGDNDKINFYCDVLFVSTVCLSGMDCTLTRRDSLIASQSARAQIFPQALAILSYKRQWTNAIPQLIEWLNYMRTSSVPDTYKYAFHASLVNLRHVPFFERGWMKYLSVKTVIKSRRCRLKEKKENTF